MGTLSRSWTDAIQKEDRLRLRWYVHNEENIRSSAENRAQWITEGDRDELINLHKHIVATNKRNVRNKIGEPTPVVPEEAEEEEHTIMDIMKPVPKAVNELIYSKGRVPYLHERYHLLPDERYYFPETSSFEIGWKIWDCAKTMDDKRYGKSAIIRQSFYRRRAGVGNDPDWYQVPTRLSPTVCNYSS